MEIVKYDRTTQWTIATGFLFFRWGLFFRGVALIYDHLHPGGRYRGGHHIAPHR